jgi:hypothetical protein
MDRDDPIRAKALTDTDDPTVVKSRTANDAPIFAFPRIDIFDPSRA